MYQVFTTQRFDFNELFVFDLANNHQGSVEHGKTIIQEVATVAKNYGVRSALKFQFRQLDTFIHPAHRTGSDNKHIHRFLSTRLTQKNFVDLFDVVRAEGLYTICTAFDEESVDVICDMRFDIIKIASCSATDWPLLEKVAATGLPVICSTGGLELHKIDDLVSFFSHRGVDFALMYCVSIYPIPPEETNLNMIDIMRNHYPACIIGWSTHENPDDTAPIQIAVAKGAQMFERHVGIETDKIKLNAYSSTPAQLDRWIAAYHRAKKMCGGSTWRTVPKVETDSINSLRRGVYAKTPIKKGTNVDRDQVFFAMPYVEGQLESGSWKNEIIVNVNIKADEPLLKTHLSIPEDPSYAVIKSVIHEVKALLNEAHVVLNSEFAVEYSHHFGIPRFREVGAVIIECINREYCKKILVQLPGQKHPAHYHKRKEETFQVLHGILHINIDGHDRTLHPGETCLIQPGVWHRFWTETGAVVEEVSTTHYNDDSFYADKFINELERSERKTRVDHWGRFQVIDIG